MYNRNMKKKIFFLVPTITLKNHFKQKLEDIEFIELDFCTDGYEGLGRLIQNSYDMIITSEHAPSINGGELLAIIKILGNMNSRIPTVLIFDQNEPTEAMADHILRNKKTLIRDLELLVLKTFKDEAQRFGPPPIPKS